MIMKNLTKIIFLLVLGQLTFSVYASPVNVNKASANEIAEALNGIGPAKAEAISKHCKKIKCSKPEDLLDVKGVGAKTLERITKDLRFSDK
jgi:competence protein ComEA